MTKFFLLTILSIVSFTSAHGVYPQLDGDIKNPFSANMQLIDQAKDMNACGFVLLRKGDKISGCSATLLEDDRIALPEHQITYFQEITGDEEGVVKGVEGIVVFGHESNNDLRDLIELVVSELVPYEYIISVLKEAQTDFGILGDGVYKRAYDHEDLSFDMVVFNVKRFNAKAKPLPLAEEDELEKETELSSKPLWCYGYGEGIDNTYVPMLLRGGPVYESFKYKNSLLIPSYLIPASSLFPPKPKTPVVGFNVLGRGDQGGPVLRDGKLFGILRSISFHVAYPGRESLQSRWEAAPLGVFALKSFHSIAHTNVTPLTTSFSRSCLSKMLRILKR